MYCKQHPPPAGTPHRAGEDNGEQFLEENALVVQLWTPRRVDCGHGSCSQNREAGQTTPQLKPPKVSLQMWWEGCPGPGAHIMVTLFHDSRKVVHHKRSEQKAALRQIW